MEALFQKVAAENGTTAEQVYREIQEAIQNSLLSIGSFTICCIAFLSQMWYTVYEDHIDSSPNMNLEKSRIFGFVNLNFKK